jgi:hypothetical protein
MMALRAADRKPGRSRIARFRLLREHLLCRFAE